MQWRCLICPFKAPGNAAQLQWSKGIESVRKDVECFFGILKGRWRILKLPLQYREHLNIDSMFFTCCILHNIIHAYDGRNQWEREVDWAGVDGRLNVSFAAADADFTAVGGAGAVAGEDEEEVEQSFFALRSDLVDHYDYAQQMAEITWLRSGEPKY
jgi:hypothetical protein